MTLLHRWSHCLSLKSKWLSRYRDWRFQISCKVFFSGNSPQITLRLGKCLIKVRIYCLLYLNLAFFTNYAIFLKMCDQNWFEVICAKSHHHVISDGLNTKENKAKMVNWLPAIRLAQSVLKCKFPSADKPSENKPLQIRAFEKYKPRGLSSEFYGIPRNA